MAVPDADAARIKTLILGFIFPRAVTSAADMASYIEIQYNYEQANPEAAGTNKAVKQFSIGNFSETYAVSETRPPWICDELYNLLLLDGLLYRGLPCGTSELCNIWTVEPI